MRFRLCEGAYGYPALSQDLHWDLCARTGHPKRILAFTKSEKQEPRKWRHPAPSPGTARGILTSSHLGCASVRPGFTLGDFVRPLATRVS